MAVDVAKPNAGVYGIYGPAYAASIARGTGNPGADIINQLALSFGARREQQGYLDALAGANQTALQGAALEGGTEVSKAYLNNLAGIAGQGLAGAVQVRQPYVTIDQGRADTSDVLTENAVQQGAVKDTAAAIKDIASVGYLPPAETVGAMITPPIQETPIEVQPYLTPGDANDRMKAEAAMIAANRPPSSGGGGGGSGGVAVQITDDGFGDPTYTFRGKDPAAVQAAYDANRGGGTGAKTAAVIGANAKARLEQYKAVGATFKTTSGGNVEIRTPKGKVIHMQVAPDGTVVKEVIKK